MCPPGLAVLSVSEKAMKRMAQAKLPRFYFDLAAHLKAAAKTDTPWTPAVSLMIQLGTSLRMILEEGMERVIERHACLARATRAGIQALGLELYAPAAPASAVTAVKVPEGVDGKKLVSLMRDEIGVTIAGGQGQATGKVFRIAHLGWVNRFDLLAGLAAVEMGLGRLGYPVNWGRSLAAAQAELRDRPV